MKVKIKKLHSEAVIPTYAKEGDAGMDLVAIAKDWKGNFVEYSTGLSIEIPEGYMGLVFPRSSISNTGLLLANSVGVIDSGYRGEIRVRFKLDNSDGFEYSVGEKIAQLIIIPYPHIDLVEEKELSISVRGDGGFGSSGK